MITENLSTLKIHRLTESQYQREKDAGRLDANALYLTPDEEIDLSPYVTKNQIETVKYLKVTYDEDGNVSSLIDQEGNIWQTIVDTNVDGRVVTCIITSTNDGSVLVLQQTNYYPAEGWAEFESWNHGDKTTLYVYDNGSMSLSDKPYVMDGSFTHNRVLVTDEDGYMRVSKVTTNELDCLSGVTSIHQKIAGIVHQYAGSNPPDGYLLCDGSFYNTMEYPELFNVIGFTYGEQGAGATLSFAVPNLVARVPVGVGSGYALGSTGGEATHALTVDEMPKHDHGATYTGNATTSNKKYSWYTTTGDKIGYQVMETGSGQAHNNMQPYIALNYIISTGK